MNLLLSLFTNMELRLFCRNVDITKFRKLSTLPDNLKNAKPCQIVARLDKNVNQDMNDGKYKPRYHPGRTKVGIVEMSKAMLTGANYFVKRHSEKDLKKTSTKLANTIWARQAQCEGAELQDRIKMIRDLLVEQGRIPKEGEVDSWEEKHKNSFYNAVKKRTPSWKRFEFTSEFECTQYIAARLAADYASLIKIFTEIRKRVPDFQPATLCDFGSGVGSVLWALNSIWPNTCKEAMLVDASPEMNEVSEAFYKQAEFECTSLKDELLYRRRFLPMSERIKYDFVVSSRSLFEIGSMENRIRIIDVLWRKINPGGILVLVEAGSNAGHRLLMESRDFLLNLTERNLKNDPNAEPIHVVAPCPHKLFCPRFSSSPLRPCNFSVNYVPLETKEPAVDSFSYVVLQKAAGPESLWPRVVDPVLHRHNHRRVKTCTHLGTLNEFVITKNHHGSNLYNICGGIRVGDELPVDVAEEEVEDHPEGGQRSGRNRFSAKNNKPEIAPVQTVHSQFDTSDDNR